MGREPCLSSCWVGSNRYFGSGMTASSEDVVLQDMGRRLEKQQFDGIMVEAEVLVDSDGALSKLVRVSGRLATKNSAIRV